MLGQPLAGVGYLLQGFGLLTKPGLRRFVAIPLAVNALIFGLLIWLLAGQFSAFLEGILPEFTGWWEWLYWLLWIIFVVVAAALIFLTFSVLANIIAAPFNGLLAEAVERHLTGQAPPSGGTLWETVKTAPGAILDELRKLSYFLLWAVPLLLLFIVPVVQLAAPILWVVFSAWVLALEYGDYPMGNHQLKGREQRGRLRQQRLLSLGFGGATLAATMIPLLNFLVMPAAVAGATLMWVRELKGKAQ